MTGEKPAPSPEDIEFSGQEFLAEKPEAQRLNYNQLVNQELEQDISVFDPETQSLIRKKLGDEKLEVKEGNIVDRAMQKWWHDKYGFPFTDKLARQEVLARKYGSNDELTEMQRFQEKMFTALEEDDEEKINTLKKEYLERFPDQLEGVEVLFGLNKYFKDKQEAEELSKNNPNKWDNKRLNLIQELTEYNFLLSHFVLENSKDKKFLSTFWGAAEEIAKRTGNLSRMHQTQRGVISQVAVYKTLEQIGAAPQLSHPKEDAFRAIDVWTDQEEAIQIKGGSKTEVIMEAETVSFPGVQTKYGDETRQYGTYMHKEFTKFAAKVDKYRKVLGKPFRAFMVAIPYSKMDFITGEPAPDFVELVKSKIGRQTPKNEQQAE